MISGTLGQLADVLQLELADRHRDVEFRGITRDSRQITPACIFAALPGTRVDGHDFAGQAEQQGAVALLVSRAVASDLPQLQVDDVQKALGRIGHWWWAQCAPVTLAVTGSNGKTTVKEMLSRILRQSVAENSGTKPESDPVLATRGNYNNELGVPLTLFELNTDHQYAVLEMGASRAGDIAYLVDIAPPRIAILNNASAAHLEGFGSEEGVARAKAEIFSKLPENGTAVINRDSNYFDLWRQIAGAEKALTFGQHPNAEVQGRTGSDGALQVETPRGSFVTRLQLLGEHNQMNALAATAAALAAGVEPEVIGRALGGLAPVPGRLNRIETHAGWVVIDDTYNANPASLYAALKVVAELPGPRMLILGDMAELGANSAKLHAEIGDHARDFGIRHLLGHGELSAHAVRAFGRGGEAFGDLDDLLGRAREILGSGTVCLVKGSRSAGMERVVRALTDAADEQTREAG